MQEVALFSAVVLYSFGLFTSGDIYRALHLSWSARLQEVRSWTGKRPCEVWFKVLAMEERRHLR